MNLKCVAHMRASKLSVLLCILLATIAFVVFLPALKGQLLTWDDFELIETHSRLHYFRFDTLIDIFRLEPRYGMPAFALYVPLTVLSVAIEYALFGSEPFVYHLTNVLLHACNTVLVFVLLHILCRRTRIAFIAALFFAVHPLHVESVAWVTERKDVLSTFFYLGALISYLRWVQAQRTHWYLLCLLGGMCAVLSKPSAVTLPLVLLLCDYASERRIGMRLLWEKVPFFFVSAFGVFATIYVQGTAGAIQRGDALNLAGNLFVAFRGILFYVVKTLAPLRLQPVYLRPLFIDIFNPVTILSVLVSFAMLFLIIRCRRRAPYVAFGLAFFLFTIAPMLQILPSGLQIVAAPRFTYLSSVGFFYIFGHVCDRLLTVPRIRFAAAVLIAAVSLWWSYMTWQYTRVWQNNISLWSYTLRHQPNLRVAKTNLAIGYMTDGQLDQAQELFHQLLEGDTNAMLLVNLATTYFTQGNISQAQVFAQLALSLNPEKSQAYFLAAAIDTKQGRPASALTHLQEVVRRNPLHAEAYVHMAAAHVALADTNAAIRALVHYTSLERSDALALFQLASLYEWIGAVAKAREAYNKILHYHPEDHNIRHRFGLMSLRLREFKTAQENFLSVVRSVPRHATAWSDLGIAYRELGDSEEAVRCSRKALKLKPYSPKILYDHACIMAMQGEIDECINALSNAVLREPILKTNAEGDPDFSALRGHKEFEDLLR